MAKEKIVQRPNVGQPMFDHPDYNVPLDLAEVLTDFLERLVKQETAYISVNAEIQYEHVLDDDECCEDKSCFMCRDGS